MQQMTAYRHSFGGRRNTVERRALNPCLGAIRRWQIEQLANFGQTYDRVLQPTLDPLRHLPSLSVALVPSAPECVAYRASVITTILLDPMPREISHRWQITTILLDPMPREISHRWQITALRLQDRRQLVPGGEQHDRLL